MAPCNLVVSNPMVTCSNPMVSLSNHGWCAQPSFDPRNKSEGMQAQDEGGMRGEVVTNPVVSLLSNHGKPWWSFRQGEATA